MPRKTREKAELGDFQTPLPLARAVCARLVAHGLAPAAVLEPTCGQGAFLQAAAETFPGARLLGLELRTDYLSAAAAALRPFGLGKRLRLAEQDIFTADWAGLVEALPDPVLVLGNPPWVTNAALGALGSANLPVKRNAEGLPGLEAMTGRSNFDLSEWLLLGLLEALAPREGSALAMLVKTSVARRVLQHAWRKGWPFAAAHLHHLDAGAHFGAAVDAGLLLVRRTQGKAARGCRRWASLEAAEPEGRIGFAEGTLLADADAWERARPLVATAPQGWRSGVKHDCAAVLELRPGSGEGALVNGLGEPVDVEPEVLYPLCKSSDLAHGRLGTRRWLLLPQRHTGEDPGALAAGAPRAWAYLQRHRGRLDRRRSRIYRGRPPFAVFGIGAYSFQPWKVAISGLYKTLRFEAVGPRDGRPVLFDDTVYFHPCTGEAEARRLAGLLRGPLAAAFFQALVFWDAKRPITARLLDRLDLAALADAGPRGGAEGSA